MVFSIVIIIIILVIEFFVEDLSGLTIQGYLVDLVIDSVNKYSILLNSVLFLGHEYYRCPLTQSANAV